MQTEFSNNQFESAYPDGIEHHWWGLARSRIVASWIKAFAGSQARVLEVGCGRGVVVKGLRDLGINCSGVELAKLHPIRGAENHIQVGIDAVDLSYEERQRYDTILLLDVIEHLPKPAIFLQNLADAFPSLSRIIITVPARQELWSNYDEHYGHYRRYTSDMLKTLSDELCWKLSQKSYLFHSVYLPAWLMLKLKKNRGIHIKAPRGINRLLHKLISYAMTADYYLFPKRLVGTSVIACLHLGGTTAQLDREWSLTFPSRTTRRVGAASGRMMTLRKQHR